MKLITYCEHRFTPRTKALINKVNEILEEHRAAGYTLSLRQIFYQLVARGVVENNENRYKGLSKTLTDAREAGLVPWDAIEDRGRWLRQNTHWNDPRDLLAATVASWATDLWARQAVRPEVWCEKDALSGIIGPVCEDLDVSWFPAKGYCLWQTHAERLRGYIDANQGCVIFYLGDHDPSGLDMYANIKRKLKLFLGEAFEMVSVQRIGLTMEQIRSLNLLPNPAKKKDSRYEVYRAEHGSVCWELDALPAAFIASLVREHLEPLREPRGWDDAISLQEATRQKLATLAGQWA
jgi:hypothetical protein